MLLCTKIRLQVSEADAAALEFMQGKCRGLYNWWVMRLRDGERWPGWAEAKASLQASRAHDPELGFVYGKLLHEVYFRLDKAMSAFFRRVRAARKAWLSTCAPSPRLLHTLLSGDVCQSGGESPDSANRRWG